MKRKCTINVRIVPKPCATNDLRCVQIQYVEGGAVFTDDNKGKGYSLDEAQDLALTIQDKIKEDQNKLPSWEGLKVYNSY